jgi:hypothetical protein
MKKIKSIKTSLKKKEINHKKKKKNYVAKYCSNPQCFKEKNYIAKFSTSSIFKKIGKDNFKQKQKKIKKKEKKRRSQFWKTKNM